MVPVPDVLRHIAERFRNNPDNNPALAQFLADVQEGRLRFFHPTTALLSTLACLPTVGAEYLYLVRYDQAAKTYRGHFQWFTVQPRTMPDFQAIQTRLNELMGCSGWDEYTGDLDNLPWPSSRLIGGLLVCRNGDGWVTIAITPTSISPAAALLHMVLAVPVTLVELMEHPEEFSMGQPHPMLDLALKSVQRITDPRRHILLSTFFDQLQRRCLKLVGAMPNEEDTFFHPENNLQVVYVLATRLYREGENERVDFWTAWEEFGPHDETLGHVIEERLHRFLKRRRSIFPDDEFPRFRSSIAIPEGVVHAGWVITRHPHDDLQSRLFVTRKLDPKTGLVCLEEAVYREYIWR